MKKFRFFIVFLVAVFVAGSITSLSAIPYRIYHRNTNAPGITVTGSAQVHVVEETDYFATVYPVLRFDNDRPGTPYFDTMQLGITVSGANDFGVWSFINSDAGIFHEGEYLTTGLDVLYANEIYYLQVMFEYEAMAPNGIYYSPSLIRVNCRGEM